MSYDTWKTQAPEDDADPFEVPCPVCTGDRAAEPCGEDCDRIVEQCRRERQIEGCRFAIRAVLNMAKGYVDEGAEPSDVRVRVCLDRVRFYRREIRKYRAELRDLKVAA